MFDSGTDHLNWVNVSRRLFYADFGTSLFFLDAFCTDRLQTCQTRNCFNAAPTIAAV